LNVKYKVLSSDAPKKTIFFILFLIIIFLIEKWSDKLILFQNDISKVLIELTLAAFLDRNVLLFTISIVSVIEDSLFVYLIASLSRPPVPSDRHIIAVGALFIINLITLFDIPCYHNSSKI
jgi:hypothetical protein